MSNLDVGAYLSARMPVWPLASQRAIADYLDRETGRIDALIAAKRRMVELLEERWLGTIHEATRGAWTPGPRRDTEVGWLGSVPSAWRVMAIKRLARVRRGASPRPIDDPVYFDSAGEFAWVRIADVSASDTYLEQTTQRLSPLGSSLSVKMMPGDLILSIAGTVGKPIITRIKCCIHDGFVYFIGLKLNRKYLYYLFTAGRLYLGLGKMGTQLNLNTDTVGSIRIPVPPPTEQEAIVGQLDRAGDRFAALREAVIAQTALLQEGRQALITVAVTGQLDIPSAA
jgi:type I restriction enzyme S subunit